MNVVYATVTAQVQLETGVRSTVLKGTHWPANDPVVREHPDWFSSDARYGMNYSVEPAGWDAPVEEATANPGEKRTARRG